MAASGSECIFCKIVSGQIPSYKVYEDQKFVAFLDIRPLTRGNCLVIPRTHYRWVVDVPEFGAYFEAARKVGQAALRALGAKWICFLTLGLEVAHAHIRVIPRFEKDLHGGMIDINIIERIDELQMQEIAFKIRKEVELN